jgi:hypothetical protein
VQADTLDSGLGDGDWFDGALYATSGDELFRSSDGFTWERVLGFPDVTNLVTRGAALKAGGDVVVYSGIDRVDANRPVENRTWCVASGAALVVHTSVNGVDWETSRIDLPIPGRQSTSKTGRNGSRSASSSICAETRAG